LTKLTLPNLKKSSKDHSWKVLKLLKSSMKSNPKLLVDLFFNLMTKLLICLFPPKSTLLSKKDNFFKWSFLFEIKNKVIIACLNLLFLIKSNIEFIDFDTIFFKPQKLTMIDWFEFESKALEFDFPLFPFKIFVYLFYNFKIIKVVVVPITIKSKQQKKRIILKIFENFD